MRERIYRCYLESGFIDVVAVSEADAIKKSGCGLCADIYEWPVPTLDDIRSRWAEFKQTKEGIDQFMKWAVAAVRLGMIDAKKFNEMQAAADAALASMPLQRTS
jgi:hypothetical protein